MPQFMIDLHHKEVIEVEEEVEAEVEDIWMVEAISISLLILKKEMEETSQLLSNQNM